MRKAGRINFTLPFALLHLVQTLKITEINKLIKSIKLTQLTRIS
jgi:hypothetical protein